jgi:hypothetical protein
MLFLSSQMHLNQLWGPPSLLFDGYLGLFPRGKAFGSEDTKAVPTHPSGTVGYTELKHKVHLNSVKKNNFNL